VPIRLEIVTPEKVVLEDDVDMVIATASAGYIGILPHHTPLLTTLGPGEMWINTAGADTSLVLCGRLMAHRPGSVVVLAAADEHRT